MGVLSREFSANKYWPRNFSKKKQQRLVFESGVEIGDELLIDFSM